MTIITQESRQVVFHIITAKKGKTDYSFKLKMQDDMKNTRKNSESNRTTIQTQSEEQKKNKYFCLFL